VRPPDAYRYARGLWRSIRRGELFPAAARIPPRAAPGGSRVAARHGAIEQTEHRVAVPGLDRPVSVLQVSDVHLRATGPEVDAACRAVSCTRPDLVVLTGDVLTRGWTREAADRFLAALPPAPLGRFAVMGNWEAWGGAPVDTYRHVLQPHGVRLLVDEAVDLGTLQLVGTDDALSGRPDLDRALRGVEHGRPTLVLAHSPGIFPRLAAVPGRVVLSGHTHGGQVRLPGVGALFLPRGSGAFPWGWFEDRGSWLFVCRGLGWSVAPLRWRSPPELAVIQLTPA
jgi:predicted MPP superfamily phosphohydrolase